VQPGAIDGRRYLVKHMARCPALVAILAISLIAQAALALLSMTADADEQPFLPKTVVSSTVPENGDVNPSWTNSAPTSSRPRRTSRGSNASSATW
jgi:hypothetical protein